MWFCWTAGPCGRLLPVQTHWYCRFCCALIAFQGLKVQTYIQLRIRSFHRKNKVHLVAVDADDAAAAGGGGVVVVVVVGVVVVIVVAVAVAVVYAYSWTTVHFGIYIKGPAPATWTQEHAVAVCCYPVPFFSTDSSSASVYFFSRSWFVSLLFFRRFIHLLLLLLVCYVLLLPLGCNNCWEESA